ncbi:MAG: hypothetical protein ACRDTF_20170 [Pseudonocardiaceae bacterium]
MLPNLCEIVTGKPPPGAAVPDPADGVEPQAASSPVAAAPARNRRR